ncbi:MAG: hypothetical protein IPK19_25590 [Chloroflexi bacterium]|nr:hypothetical protein [Chloroflexota bacterium]
MQTRRTDLLISLARAASSPSQVLAFLSSSGRCAAPRASSQPDVGDMRRGQGKFRAKYPTTRRINWSTDHPAAGPALRRLGALTSVGGLPVPPSA